MIGALRKGSTGDQILDILEAIVGLEDNIQELKQSDPEAMTYGTLGFTEFWYSRLHIGG